MTLIGFHITFLNGVGTIEATGKLHTSHLTFKTMTNH